MVLTSGRPGCLPIAALPATKGSLAMIGRIAEDVPNAGRLPDASAAGRGHAMTPQAATDFANRDALAADPAEDLPHDLGLLGNDLVARHTRSFSFAHIPIAIGRSAQGAEAASAGGVQAAAATAF